MADEVFDPRSLSVDEFLLGPDCDEDSRELVIDNVFAKPFATILEDQATFQEGSGLETVGWPDTPSDLVPGYCFRTVEAGLLLVSPLGDVVGGYLATDVAIQPEHQGRGLGKELILEFVMREGRIPTWDLDDAAYSRGGVRAHRGAWELAGDRALYEKKAGRLREMMAGDRNETVQRP